MDHQDATALTLHVIGKTGEDDLDPEDIEEALLDKWDIDFEAFQDIAN